MTSLLQPSRLGTLFVAVSASALLQSQAAEITLAQRLQAPAAATGDQFGGALALELPYLLVGAPGRGDGVAYVFWKDPNGGVVPWVYHATLTPSALSANAQFGSSVAFKGVVAGNNQDPRIAVGASSSDGQGAVYFFDGSWSELSKLTAPLPDIGDSFGIAVSMSSGYLAVGAPGEDGLGLNTGSVFLYRRELGGIGVPFTWELLATKRDPGSVPLANFGLAVANDDQGLVVGAPAIAGFNAGVALIFDRDAGGVNNWGEVRTLSAPDGHAGGRFGMAVAIDDQVVAVADPLALLEPGFAPGAVYLYGRDVGGNNQWGLLDRLIASDAEHEAQFGFSLAFSDGVLAVGAPRHSADKGAPGEGAVYLYGSEEGGGDRWGEIGRINLPGEPGAGLLGVRVALEGTVLAGASPLSDIPGAVDSGAVTMFYVPPVEQAPSHLIDNGDFSGFQLDPYTGGLPSGTGFWRTKTTVEPVEAATVPGVSAVIGTKILQFVASGGSSNPTTSATCDVYQLVDLTPYADHVSTGRVVARFSFEVNRIAGDAQTDDRFVAQLRSYDGAPSSFPTTIFGFTGTAETTASSDDDAASWERVNVELSVPAGTTYLAARIAAIENVSNDIVWAEFDGHYADNASLLLRVVPPEPEIVEIEMLNNCDLRLRHTTDLGFHYRIQKSTNLRDWTTIRWGIVGTGAELTPIVAGGLIPSMSYRILARW